MINTLPKVSKYESPDRSDGSIDPLGIYPLSERLAQKMVSGVRERQKYPRFLTIMALSKLFESYLLEEVGDDIKAEPWESFEWFFVQLFTKVDSRMGEEAISLSGLPGTQKAKRVLDISQNLSPQTYLAVPSVFGFHGVYRILAKEVKLLTDERLNEIGNELLDIWVHEQNLEGFLFGSHGKSDFRKELLHLVKKGCLEGHACLSPRHYDRFSFLYNHLHHRKIGKAEQKKLWEILLHDPESHRGEILAFIDSREGQKYLEEAIQSRGERHFHKGLEKVASKDLRVLLAAIFEYEAFARLLDNHFSEMMDTLTRSSTSLSDLAATASAKEGAEKINDQYQKAYEALQKLDLDIQFSNLFQEFSDVTSAKGFVELLTEHHIKVQGSKGPVGKATWIIKNADNYSLNRWFKREFKTAATDAYVNFYRMHSLRQFSIDLGRIA